jgi:LysM repeat protein
MRRFFLVGLIPLLLAMTLPSTPQRVRFGLAPLQSTAGQVIAGVNALRTSRGLNPFQTNSILMRVCQAQSDYMASIGTYSDTDAQGRGTMQRTIAAGYPASRASENVFEGTNATAQDAINFWMGDALHRIALLDPGLVDVGAGVTVVGNTYYYCQIAALSGGGSTAPGTSAPPAAVVVPIVVSTPNPDGSIVHVVQPGDTLLAIARAYGIALITLEQLNRVTNTTTIYPGDKLIIRPAFTATVTTLTLTSTQTPTATQVSSTATATGTPLVPTPLPNPGMHASTAGVIFIMIVLIALVSAGAITVHGSKNRR